VNDINRTSAPPRCHPGKLMLFLGMLVAVTGVGIYVFQLRAKDLSTPWYMPILATVGLALVLAALVRSRTVWRWIATVVFALFAGVQWLMLLVLLATPAYTGPAKAGEAFPTFVATTADGSTFTQENLKGDSNTILLFFRGRW
jgi:hypothetical protein